MVDWVSFGISLASLILSVILTIIGLVVAYLTLLYRINPFLEIIYEDEKFFIRNNGRGFVYNLKGYFTTMKNEKHETSFIYVLNVGDKKQLNITKTPTDLAFLRKYKSGSELTEEDKTKLSKQFEIQPFLFGYFKYRNEFRLKRKTYFFIYKKKGVCVRKNKRDYRFFVKYTIKKKHTPLTERVIKKMMKLQET
ncbi:MAG: hypothetical protein HZR80_03545 [Candidatus Heimdallarchaeota archaeon]